MQLYTEHLPTPAAGTQLFGAKLAIVLKDSVTQSEQLLAEEEQTDLAQKVRDDLNSAMQPQVKKLVHPILGVEVLDILSDATLETGRTGIIIVLSGNPQVRNPEAIPKMKKA